MGIFDGPLFDFNGDGKTDAFEFAMAMSIIDEIEKEELEQEKDPLWEDDEKELFDADFDDDFDDDSKEWL